MQSPIFTDRETARRTLIEKIAAALRQLADPRGFSTFSPHWLIEDAEWRLRWIDCAPEGANHQCAPLQDKHGVPMGGIYNENIGPNQALRAARAAHGLNPNGGNQ